MARKPASLFETHTDRADLVMAITTAIQASWESRYTDRGDYQGLASALAEHVVDRRLDKLTYLTNGFNEADKQLFSAMTGLSLPKSNNTAYARLREWCGVSETLDELNTANAQLEVLRGSMFTVYPETFAESEATIMALIASGYTQIRKASGAEYLCSNTSSAVYVLAGRAEAKTSLYGTYRELIHAVVRVKNAGFKHDDYLRLEETKRQETKSAEMARRKAQTSVRSSFRLPAGATALHFL